jgi:hypothetical protein
VHALHVSGREKEQPGIQVVAPEEVDPPLAFFALAGKFLNVQELHRSSFAALSRLIKFVDKSRLVQFREK